MIQPRAFNKITLNGGIIHKFSKSDALKHEMDWYRQIPPSLNRYIPDPTICSDDEIMMGYVKGQTLHELFISGRYGIDEWDVLLNNLKGFTDEMGRYSIPSDNESIMEMYSAKTKYRLNSLKDHPYLSRYYVERPIINGIEYPTICEILEGLDDSVRRLSRPERFQIIHGDLHFGNLINSDRGVIAIDPRGQFGKHTIYGDFRYDMAKLYHSVEGGYDYITEDMFHLDTSDGIDYEICTPEYGFDMTELLRKIFDYNEKEVRFIESLLFLSMIPLHYDYPLRQIVMFARGMELFRRATL